MMDYLITMKYQITKLMNDEDFINKMNKINSI